VSGSENEVKFAIGMKTCESLIYQSNVCEVVRSEPPDVHCHIAAREFYEDPMRGHIANLARSKHTIPSLNQIPSHPRLAGTVLWT